MSKNRPAISSSVATQARRVHREKFLLGREKPRISLLIPAKNEARNLPFVLERVPADLHEVILIDGNSTDDTIEVAKEFYPGIRVIPQRADGKGSALVTGMLAATGDIIVMIDADGILIPPNDPTALADAIKDLWGDPGRRQRLSKAGVQRARDFTLSKVGPRFLQVYQSAIDAARKRDA